MNKDPVAIVGGGIGGPIDAILLLLGVDQRGGL